MTARDSTESYTTPQAVCTPTGRTRCLYGLAVNLGGGPESNDLRCWNGCPGLARYLRLQLISLPPRYVDCLGLLICSLNILASIIRSVRRICRDLDSVFSLIV